MRLTDELQVTQRELSDILRPSFPLASAAVISLAERTNLTGVQFAPAAVKAARTATGRVKHAEKRKNGKRLTLWLTKPMLEFLKAESPDGNLNALLRAVISRAMGEGGFHL